MLRLERERRRRGWSQAEVARRCGVHPVVVSNLERRRVHPWPGWKRRLAQVFGLPGDRLFEEVAEDEQTG